MKNGEITTDTTEIPRIKRDYLKQLFANKMDNMEKNVQILRKVPSSKTEPRLNQ